MNMYVIYVYTYTHIIAISMFCIVNYVVSCRSERMCLSLENPAHRLSSSEWERYVRNTRTCYLSINCTTFQQSHNMRTSYAYMYTYICTVLY